MKKKFKISIIASVLVIGIGLGAGQVYAASTLGTNILDLIKTQFIALTSSYTGKTASDMDASKRAATTDVDKHVSDKSSQALNELDQQKQSEVQRGTSDINSYADQVKNDADAAIDSEKNNTKTAITNKVDSMISDTKSAIQDQLQQSIKNNLQPKQ